MKQIEVIEVAQVEELSRLREENMKLKGEIRSHDEKIKALASDNADLTDKVVTFEARAWAAKEYLKEVGLVKDPKSQGRQRKRW